MLPFALALFHDLGNDVEIHLGHVADLRFDQAAALVGLDLVDHRHVGVALELGQVHAHEVAQFFDAVRGPVDLLAEAVEHLLALYSKKWTRMSSLFLK